MTGIAPLWNSHRKPYLDPSVEKSAYVVFVEFCSDMVLDVPELALMCRRPLMLKGSLFHIADEVAADLADAMGIDIALWDRARGVELRNAFDPKKALLGDLRHCLSCLRRGHHSALFQLPHVVACPIHAERLRSGCPHCGKPLATDARTLVRDHFYCGNCHSDLASERQRTSFGESDHHPPAHRFATLRRLLTEPPPPGELHNGQWRYGTPPEIAASPGLVRLQHARMLWGDPSMGPEFLPIRTVSIRVLEADHLPQPFLPEVRRAMIAAFEALAAQFSDHVGMLPLPWNSAVPRRGGGRWDTRQSVLVVAFWRAAAAMDVLRFVFGGQALWSGTQPLHDWFPRHMEAMQLLVQRQVQVLFVRSLLQMRKLRYGVQVDWSGMPDAALYLVPWRLRPTAMSGWLELQIRTHVDATTVRRLVQRYRQHWLEEVPEGMSPLALIHPAGT